MPTLPEIADAVKTITDQFAGSFTMKSPGGTYFHVNDYFLEKLGLFRENVIGKKDKDIFPQERADFVEKTDKEAFDSREPVEYTSTMVFKDQNFQYYAVKWVFFLPQGLPFCICTLSDYLVNKQRVLDFKQKINIFLEKLVPAE